MGYKRGVIISGIVILILFEVILLINNKIELAYYNLLLLAMFILVYFLDKKLDVSNFYLFGLILIGLMNALGGLVFIDEVRLYDYYFGFVKWDMLIHIIGMFFSSLIIYDSLHNYIKLEKGKLIFIAGLVALGIGAIFEVLEFFGVVLLNNQGVGDYFNNAADLVSNLVGVILAGLWILFRKQN